MPGTTKSVWVAKEVVHGKWWATFGEHNNRGVGLVSLLGILRFWWADSATDTPVSGICEVSIDFESIWVLTAVQPITVPGSVVSCQGRWLSVAASVLV